MEESKVFAEGDWIVHSNYGIGQIQGIEVKDISGKDTRYYRINATDSAFWMPVDQMDSEELRPLSTPDDIEKAISTLRKPPKAMSSNFKTRQNRIRQAQIQNTPNAMARLIRDLRGRQRNKGLLNGTELSAFRTFKQRLIEEWAMVTGAATEAVELKLEELLDPERAKTEKKDGATPLRETAVAGTPPRQRKLREWTAWPKRQTNKINR